MTKKVRRPRKRLLSQDLELAIKALGDRKVIVDLEKRCLQVEKDYADLRSRIVKFLSADQIEAAKVCGCSPEIYALEWFEICKDTIREHTPSFANYVKGPNNLF